ncbi:hypothetical protein PS1_005474 [Malus domestica]
MIAIPYLTALTTYFSYGSLFVFDQVRDFFRKIIDWWSASNICSFDWSECFNRLIASAPDAWFDVVERYSNDYNKTLQVTITNFLRFRNFIRCLNLGSYNYLGFAASDEYCTPHAIETLKKYSPSTCSSRVNGGTMDLHNELEECVANFVGKPAAIVFGMGYVTNSVILPILMGKGDLIVSDSLNHNSIVNGARGSGTRVCVFQHNILRKSKNKEEPVLEDLPKEYYDDSPSGTFVHPSGVEHYLSDSINALRNCYGDKQLITPF